MDSFKVSWGLRTLQLICAVGAQAILLLVLLVGSAAAESCLPPPRPFVPSDNQAARDYADIIRSDFEVYIRDIQRYFRCLDQERARAFKEAREVSQEYGRFLQTVGE